MSWALPVLPDSVSSLFRGTPCSAVKETRDKLVVGVSFWCMSIVMIVMSAFAPQPLELIIQRVCCAIPSPIRIAAMQVSLRSSFGRKPEAISVPPPKQPGRPRKSVASPAASAVGVLDEPLEEVITEVSDCVPDEIPIEALEGSLRCQDGNSHWLSGWMCCNSLRPNSKRALY